MKAVLEFNLDEPDDRQSHMRAVKALDLTIALWDVQEYLHRKIDNGQLTPEQRAVFEEIQKEFFSIKDNHNITFEDILS